MFRNANYAPCKTKILFLYYTMLVPESIAEEAVAKVWLKLRRDTKSPSSSAKATAQPCRRFETTGEIIIHGGRGVLVLRCSAASPAPGPRGAPVGGRLCGAQELARDPGCL